MQEDQLKIMEAAKNFKIQKQKGLKTPQIELKLKKKSHKGAMGIGKITMKKNISK